MGRNARHGTDAARGSPRRGRRSALRRDRAATLRRSKGRFASIAALMALGSFALVGLFVTAPDMQATGASYYGSHNLADATVVSEYGLTEDDQEAIRRTEGVAQAEFSWFKDVTIANSSHAVRIFSTPQSVSTVEVIEGRLPADATEIALGSGERGIYAVGSTFRIDEPADIAGDTVLASDSFRVVGFVNASDIVSHAGMGSSTAGTGDLAGYGFVADSAFDSPVAMLGRVTFTSTQGMDYWEDGYADAVQEGIAALDGALADRPALREESLKEERRAQIAEARGQLDESRQQLQDAQTQLDDAKSQIDAAKDAIAQGKADAVQEGADLASQLAQAGGALTAADSRIAAAQAQLASADRQIAAGEAQLANGWTSLTQAQTALEDAKSQIQSAGTQLDAIGDALNVWRLTGVTGSVYERLVSTYNQAVASYESSVGQYNATLDGYDSSLGAWRQAAGTLEEGSADYQANTGALAQAAQEAASGKQRLSANVASIAQQAADDAGELITGQRALEQAEEEYEAKLAEFNEAKPQAEADIAEAQARIDAASQKVDGLSVPAYTVASRSEGLTGKGYAVYETISQIVTKLAAIFPPFLYMVAALVTFSTMGRMVDEERGNAGTLKALGYSNASVMAKYTLYGFAASTIGTAVGVALGHTLLPLIVYSAYGKHFILPRIELHWYPAIAALAFVFGWLAAIAPTWLVALRDAREQPASLLRPKPPAKGSRILLERVKPVWNRLNFTGKVTARNIFRYKGRMFMTIFGVCGAVAMLAAGLGVQASIRHVADRQFDELVTYDLIVAERSDNSDAESQAVADSVAGNEQIDQSTPIRYEEMSLNGDATQGRQSITMIATDDAYALASFITLGSRNGASVALTDRGAVVSESLASMLGAAEGDVISVEDSTGTQRSFRVAGITEMYIGHFLFLSADGYGNAFGTAYAPNAHMVSLADADAEAIEQQAAAFVAVDGVKSVVQNTAMRAMVDRIVTALDIIMTVLVVVATLLAMVILYNLTNLNVSERMRELSTLKVLGFTDREVTMYIYRETVLLSALGILAGFAFGEWLRRFIIAEVSPPDVMFDPALQAVEFVVPIALVAVVLVVLGIMVHRRLRDVDMLEALKSVE